MEKKKLLLISVSVGLFLVIVIGASILAFSPRNNSALDVGSAAVSQSALGRTEAPPPVPAAGTVPPPIAAGSVIDPVTITETPPVVPFTGNNVIYINGENAENAVKIERTSDGGTKTYITIPSPQTGANSQGTGTPAAVAAAPMAPAGEPKTTAAAPKAPPAKAAPKVTRNDYWIQVGSYSLKSRADDAKSYLAEKKGLGSIIVDSNLNGKVVYRVRVGPYTSQSEAKYWLSLIKEIEGMNDSIVWKSTVTM